MRRGILFAMVVSATACKGGDESQASLEPSSQPSSEPSSEPPGEAPSNAKPPAAEAEAAKPVDRSEPAAAGDDAPGGLTDAVADAIGEAKGSESILLIPDGATVIAGADVAAVVKQPLFELFRGRLGRRQREQLEAATACNVGPDKWRHFVIGFDPKTRNMAMVTDAVGLGTKATLSCLRDKIGSFELSEDFKTLKDHTGGGIVVSDDAIAFATPAWMDPLRERIAGKGTAAVRGGLKAALTRTAPSKPVWFAGLVPPPNRAQLEGFVGSGARDFAGWVDIGDAWSLRIAVAVADPNAAKSKLQMQWMAFRGLATSSGVPESVAKSVEFTASKSAVSVSLEASESDLRTAVAKFMHPAFR